MIERTFIEERKYQSKILTLVDENIQQGKNIVIELDCGMGKRILMYLLLDKHPDKNIMVILQSTASLLETRDYFQKLGLKNVVTISSKISGRYRQKLLAESKIVLSTPQSLENTLKKIDSTTASRFDFLIINEIDLLVRRTAYGRTMVFPYNSLLPRFSNATVIGLSGTLRDSHLLVNIDNAEIVKEIDTLSAGLKNMKVISMEEILTDTDFNEYVSLTRIIKFPVIDKKVSEFLQGLDMIIKQKREEIKEDLSENEPDFMASIPGGSIDIMIDRLPVDEKIKNNYLSLLMIRKYLVSMIPSQAKRFLYRVKELDKEKIRDLPLIPARINVIIELIEKQDETRAVILCSYIKTAESICDELERNGYSSFLITGQVSKKNEVLNQFRSCQKPCGLVMTSVGERDLDIQEAKLLIIYDTINTIKTMYQRLKRTRGGTVVFLYYPETSEERKVSRLMYGIKKKYPWTVEVFL
ncbi:MAG: helicase-related protein [Candidatus Hodarchaeales archaeon]